MQTTTPRARRAARRARRATRRAMRRPVPRIILTLADGTRRVAPRVRIGQPEQDGILCPFCEYPSEGTACRNPACDTQLDAAQLAARNAQRQAQDGQREREAALQASLERSRTEAREAEQARYNEAMAQARAAGQCTACLARSLRTGGWTRARFTRHRDPANCPEARR